MRTAVEDVRRSRRLKCYSAAGKDSYDVVVDVVDMIVVDP